MPETVDQIGRAQERASPVPSTRALYRKYRSRTFAELVGQEHVTRTLRNAARTGRVAHAYLFSGPRGVGKTSAARLLAKAVNCTNSTDGEPCDKCDSCVAIAEGRAIDVVEIDAASNRGIDEIRGLRERVGYAPAGSRYRFYILDEAHMLTGEAANAFLKTLEEPPEHAVFVLVTTEAHRVPATVVSRCQRLEFRRLTMRAIVQQLDRICSEEGIASERAALELIARSATGSMRDAIALLDQLVAYSGDTLTVDQIRAVIGLAGTDVAVALLSAVLDRAPATGLRLINRCVDEGADPRLIAREVVDLLRSILLVKAGPDLADVLDLTEETVADVKRLAQRVSTTEALAMIRIFLQTETQSRALGPVQLPLELALLDSIDRLASPAASPVEQTPTPLPRSTPRPLPRQARPPDPSPVEPAAPAASPELVPPAPEPSAPGSTASPTLARQTASPAPAFTGALSDIAHRWSDVIERMGNLNRTVQAILRDARPISYQAPNLTLGTRHTFHRDRLNEDRTRATIESALRAVLGGDWVVRCVVDDGSSAPAIAKPIDRLAAVMEDPVVKGAITLGWRVRRITKNQETVYDAESQNDTAAPGAPGEDAGGPR